MHESVAMGESLVVIRSKCSMLKCSMDRSQSNESWSNEMNYGAAKPFLVMHKTGATVGVIGVELRS